MNNLFVFGCVLTYVIGTLQYGYVVNENLVLERQFIHDYGWDTNSMKNYYMSIIYGFTSAGSCLGALVAGFTISSGRRKTLIWANLIGILASCVSLVSNIWLLTIGRVLTGFSAGMMIVVVPKAIEETVPNYFTGTFVAFVSLSINGGLFLSVMAGSYMPPKIDDEDSTWRAILAFPIAL